MKKRKKIFNFPQLIFTKKVEQSKAINFIKEPCIVIAGNGMCSAGRIKHHIRNSIENPKNTLLFIGYQAEGTLGYWIKKGEKRVRLLGVEVDVNSKIENIEGFSAHADCDGLLKWLKSYKPKPKKVFINHGEEKESIAFSEKAKAENFKVYIPSALEMLEI
jgi:metallo-beta-lactamase family protein